MQTQSLFDEGFQFYHDSSLHYPISSENPVRVDTATGDCVMFFGMRDYLKDGERTRKKITFVSGPPTLLMEAHDQNGVREWDGVLGISWEPKGPYAYYNQNCITDPELISEHYSPETAVTNDNTEIRVSFVFALNANAKFLIKRDGAANRTVSAYNVTKVVLNQNEYICSVISSSGNVFFNQLSSGVDNAIKITINFDLAFDFTNDLRGLALFSMSDTIAQTTEAKIS